MYVDQYDVAYAKDRQRSCTHHLCVVHKAN